MNEQIRLLAEQATKHYPATESSGEFSTFDKEKFAELIVRECASLTLDFSKPSADYYHGWLDYRDEILKHFGVKK